MNTQERTSADVAALLQAAVAAHQGGALDDAARQYDRVLALEPDHVEALYLAGGLAYQRGQAARARDLLQRCLAFRPDHAFAAEALGAAALSLGDPALAVASYETAVAHRSDAHLRTNLARSYVALARLGLGQGKPGDAERDCRRARDCDPQNVDALYVLANALRVQRRYAEAAETYAEVVALQPALAPAFDEYGGVLFELGRIAEAEQVIGQSIALAPQAANAYTNLGRLYFPDPAKAAWALESHDKAIALQPDHAEAHSNRGTALYLLGRYDDAAESHRKAIALKPDLADAYSGLGGDLLKLADAGRARYDDAIAAFQQALSRGAQRDTVLCNIGVAWERSGHADQALDAYAGALCVNPELAEARMNKGLIHLRRNEFADGWRDYEYRWGAPSVRTRPVAQPMWDGRRDLTGALLVSSEQGVGDEILHARMAGELAAAGMNVIFQTDARLVPLFARSWPALRVVPRHRSPSQGLPTAEIVAQIPVGSLGTYLRRELDAFPSAASYLRPDPDRAAAYRRRLRADGRGDKVIGISWISKSEKIGAHKSTELKALAPLLKTPGVHFVDLQYGDTAAERADAETALGVSVDHLPDLDVTRDLDGLAALIAACDLVVTVSNTTAHLAGALGIPTWVLVPADRANLWYWGEDGDTTPWYPSVRLFRQSISNDWTTVIADVARALRAGA